MSIERIERDGELAHLAGALRQMKAAERIPAPVRKEAIRTRLLGSLHEMKLSIFETRIGWVGVAFSDNGIARLQLPRSTRAQTLHALQRSFPESPLAPTVPSEVGRELREYANGHRRRFDLTLDWSLVGPFQRAVLQAASRIPFGETRTYGWIAREIGKPQASRAVGRALGANPLPIVLPCHRVIGSDGGLCGYGGGLPLKRKLLKLEGAEL